MYTVLVGRDNISIYICMCLNLLYRMFENFDKMRVDRAETNANIAKAAGKVDLNRSEDLVNPVNYHMAR